MCPIWIKQTMCHKASSDHGWLFSYRFSCYPLETKGNINTEGFSVLERSHSISAGCRQGSLIFPPLLGASRPSTMGTMALAHLYVCQRCPQALCCLCQQPCFELQLCTTERKSAFTDRYWFCWEYWIFSPSSKPGSDTKKKPPNEMLCRVRQEALELGDGGSHLGSLAWLPCMTSLQALFSWLQCVSSYCITISWRPALTLLILI